MINNGNIVSEYLFVILNNSAMHWLGGIERALKRVGIVKYFTRFVFFCVCNHLVRTVEMDLLYIVRYYLYVSICIQYGPV